MLNKELFLKTLATMEKYNNLTNEFCAVLEKMSPDCYCDAFIYTDYELLLIESLKQYFDVDEMDTILYFIYDLNYGKEYMSNCFLENEKDVDLSSAEKLYEYLERCEKYKEENK